MSFKKDTEKIVLLKVKGLIHIVKFRTKKNCIFLSSATSQSSFRAVASWLCMHVPRISANKAYRKNCLQEFPILLALNYYTFMYTCDFYRYEQVYT